MDISWQQKLRNAIYQVKFANMPGTHDNGTYKEELTVEEALNQVAKLMGVEVSNPKPLYFTELEPGDQLGGKHGKLYSRVTSRWYDLSVYSDFVVVKYQDKWHECASERAAMNFISMKELEEAPTEQGIKDGQFNYHA